MTPEVEEAWQNIVDCFTCTDGCVSFVRLQQMVEEMDRQAQIHNPAGTAAFQIVRVIHQLSRMVDIARGKISLEA